MGSDPELDASHVPLQPGLDPDAAEGDVLAGLLGDGGAGVDLREPALPPSPRNAGTVKTVYRVYICPRGNLPYN